MNGLSSASLKLHYRSSGETASSNSSVSSTDSLHHSGSGSLALFTFVEPVRRERHHYLDAEHQRNCKGTLEVSPLFRDGMLLTSKEKGVNFPVVHFTDDPDTLQSFLQSGKFLGEHNLGDHTILHQGVYKEVRSISPRTDTGFPQHIPELDSNTTSYMLLGFKSQDKTFSQMMVDTWKDWTGARFIYITCLTIWVCHESASTIKKHRTVCLSSCTLSWLNVEALLQVDTRRLCSTLHRGYEWRGCPATLLCTALMRLQQFSENVFNQSQNHNSTQKGNLKRHEELI